MSSTFGFFYIIVFLAGLALVVSWIVLPFAIIGTKPLLEKLLRETQRTNELLHQLKQQLIQDHSS